MARRLRQFLILVIVSYACGQKSGTTGSATCSFQQTISDQVYNYCSEYSGLKSDQSNKVKDICLKDTAGTWEAGGSCGSESLVGRCAFQTDEITFTYYYYAAFSAQEAEANCNAALGKWQSV